MKVVAIIQARTGSTRLPGKVLLDLAGEPMLARVVARTRRATMIDEVVIATSTRPADNTIAEMCTTREWLCFRGSEEDVLDRYYRAAVAYDSDVVVRITSDCPLIEPQIVDRVIQAFMDRQPEVDYASNDLPKSTFPRGLDTEVIRIDALKRAWREDLNLASREHVTPYILHHPDFFRLHGIVEDADLSHMRWTVDTEEDFALVRRIFAYFGHDHFTWKEVVSLLNQYPQWLELNRHVQQKTLPDETRRT